MTPDPKPLPRIQDADAIRAAKLAYPWCAACGQFGGNGHHVIPKGEGGDDVVENIVVLCGSGTARCHGAFHGNPYDHGVVRQGQFALERRDGNWVRFRVGNTLRKERPDVIAYVLRKLGDIPGREYLLRVYHLEVQ